jgi:predicted kinase
VHLQSDVTRKRLFGVEPEVRLDRCAYEQAASERVYARLQEDAATALAADFPVVADATFLGTPERAAIEAVAKIAGAPFAGIWLDAPRSVLEDRIRARTADPSDATVAVLAGQLGADRSTVVWPTIDAADGAVATTARVLRHLGRHDLPGLRTDPDARTAPEESRGNGDMP